MTTTLQEGRWTWTFHTGIQSIKYDDTAYYRHRFSTVALQDALGDSHSPKGVDFVAWDARIKILYLLEVKDFTQGHGRSRDKMPLADELAAKVLDTLAGLFCAANTEVSDQADERIFAQASRHARSIRMVVYMALPPPPMRRPSNAFPTTANVQQKLRQLLKWVAPQARVMDRMDDSPSASLPWAVSPVPTSSLPPTNAQRPPQR